MEQADRDKILSAIVTNMSPAVVVEVRRAAVAGLNHALDFAEWVRPLEGPQRAVGSRGVSRAERVASKALRACRSLP
jgi:hypothetical protein